MKKIGCCLFIFLTVCKAEAQSDIQAMLKQIAQLEIYIVQLEKGYKIAREGLTTISGIKKGEFSLHSVFFSSLKTVNPAIAKYSKIAEILSDQASIVHLFKNLSKIKAGLSNAEAVYIKQVADQLSVECSKDLNALMDVLTDGKIEMTDDERIKRINHIWQDMNEKKAFALGFTNKAGSLITERKNQRFEMSLIKTFE